MQRLYISCYAMDHKCYDRYGLSEDILMEHAARAMADRIRHRFAKGASVLIVCGPGNNGGDGMVLARQLYGDYDVRLYVPFGAKSLMATTQWERTITLGLEEVNRIEEADIIVDALFGAGLSRPLDDKAVTILKRLNGLGGYKIACDIPTGLDERGNPSPVAFHADTTVTMGALKEALYADAAKDYVGDIACADLGVARSLYEDPSDTYVLDQTDFHPPHRRLQASHKGSYGHAAVLCGEKEGAGIMAALAASRFGAGLTTVVLHERVHVPPELMHDTVVPTKATALAVGPGLGAHFEEAFLRRHLIQSDLPIVLDADAFASPLLLEILSQSDRAVVLTPHPKEFATMWRLVTNETLDVETIQADRFGTARHFSRRFPHAVLLLKGANPVIAHRGELFVNPHGTPALAKGGSGDVLTGLIVALLAQGYDPKEAAIQASLAHTHAADCANGNDFALTATDLIAALKSL